MHPVQCPADKRPLELLAPAGGLEAGYAAIHYGADAVYLGLPRFSARAEAANLAFEDVAAITGYAHSRKVRRRVYVTVNTLIQASELDELAEALAAVAALGVDAIIVQDLGVYRILRRHFPELRLHASTQMTIHNRAGVEFARELGFARVTLARELTLEELADITGVPGIETEVFIHGALCFGYSGLCLYSSHMLGRSGNRGRCAYLCRDQYRRGDERGFVFSMKDLALTEFVPQLRRAGVTALKIEGRMKSPLYVAATVNYYRQLLDGALTAEKAKALAADIQTVFSRPWTNLFLPNRWNRNVIDPEYVGHRGYPVGRVEKIVRLASGEVRLRFHPSQALEVHDGLQMDVPGLPRPYGFAVERLRVLDGAAGAQTGLVFEAPAGALVEVALPGDHPEIPESAVVYCSSSQEIKRRYRFEKPKPGLFLTRSPVNFEVHIAPDEIRASACLVGMAGLLRSPDAISATMEISGQFHAAHNADQMRVAVEQAFGKLGATRFAAAQVTVHNPQACFVPISFLNQMRRQITDQLEARYQEALSACVANVKAALAPVTPVHDCVIHAETSGVAGAPPSNIVKNNSIYGGASSSETVLDAALTPVPTAVASQASVRWCLKTDQPGWLDAFEDSDWQGVDEVILEVPPDATNAFDVAVRHVAERIGAARLRLALPVIIRRWEQAALQKTIRRLAGGGWHQWQAANLGAWDSLRTMGEEKENAKLDISADWPLFVLNHVAAEQVLALGATRLTLSPEDDGNNMRSLLATLGDKAAVIVYQDTPLMISEVCIFPSVGCDRKGTCRSGEALLASSFGEQVRVINRHCRMVVIREKPFCLAPHIPALASAGARILRADFMYRAYTAEQVRAIWRRLRAGQSGGVVPGTHAGNFERGLR
ncbi:MAG: U32 family peptidase [Kiritimatiellae bacterium]|nr:U32 family peptidase [Kiritimatiellia bacterium]